MTVTVGLDMVAVLCLRLVDVRFSRAKFEFERFAVGAKVSLKQSGAFHSLVAGPLSASNTTNVCSVKNSTFTFDYSG